ncbi:MAG: hypothetical protein PHW02_06160 [bacterium]|nr:hypothetical protein [bacterium]
MKSNDRLFQFFILIAAMTSLVSLEKTSWSMNFFLLPSIAFTFTGSMIFLIHEKHIINNFMRTYKGGLKAGLTAAIFFFALYFSIHFLSGGAAFIIFLSSYIAYRIIKRKVYPALLAVFASLVFGFLLPSSTPSAIARILIILSSFAAGTVLMFMLRETLSEFAENPKESLCYANVIIALISVPLFFLTKSGQAAILTGEEKTHLFLLTFVYSFLASSLLILQPGAMRPDRRVMAVSAAISAAVLSLFFFSLYFIAGVLIALIALFFEGFSLKKKGIGVTETMAIMTLSAILLSMVLPLYDKVRSEIMVRNDKKLFEENKEEKIENAIKIGGYYIKSADNRIKFVYKTDKSKFRWFTAE